jgi:hypothetical protein
MTRDYTIETTFPKGTSTEPVFSVVDPHPDFPIVLGNHSTREDAEATLAEFKREDAITESFDAWIHATADEYGVDRQVVANLIDVDQFRVGERW